MHFSAVFVDADFAHHKGRACIFSGSILHAKFTFFDSIFENLKSISKAENPFFESAFRMPISRFSIAFWIVLSGLRRPRVHFLKVHFA